jgi:hypothetical protein
MNLNDLGTVVQTLTLPVLAATVWATWKGAKAAQQSAQIAFRQFEVAREQLHASFRPALDAKGSYGPNFVDFTFRNIGAGPAFNVTAQYIGRVRIPLGNLERGENIAFRFDNHLNIQQRVLGMGKPDTILPPAQDAPLRLEFDSATGAHCWTNVQFKVGGDSSGPVEITTEQGIDAMTDSGFKADGP